MDVSLGKTNDACIGLLLSYQFVAMAVSLHITAVRRAIPSASPAAFLPYDALLCVLGYSSYSVRCALILKFSKAFSPLSNHPEETAALRFARYPDKWLDTMIVCGVGLVLSKPLTTSAV